jgi:hypothetical protein
MNAELQAAINNYNAADKPSKEDRETARDFIVATLHETGMSYRDVFLVLRIVESGEWNDGWERGYASAQARFQPSFSLNGSRS